jgi:hypothetical protein
MKATDLMIDDWVEYGEYITTVRNLSNVIVLSGCIGRLEEVRPVPLTPKILEKNGFHINGIKEKVPTVINDWSDDTYVWSRQETPDEKMMVSVYMDDINNFFVEVICQYCHVNGIHIRYVHELQHTLKLCQIIKEIVL